MPYLEDGSNKIYETTEIGQRATRHYRQIFGEAQSTEPLQGPHDIDEAALAEKLAQPQEDYEFAVTSEDVADAFRDCPKGKTAGMVSLPAEAWNAAIEAEPRLAVATAWAWNMRLQNWPSTLARAGGQRQDRRGHRGRGDDLVALTSRRRSGRRTRRSRARMQRHTSRARSSEHGAAAARHTLEAPDPWQEVDVRLLPKQHRPTEFRLSRPITILTVSAKAFTKVLKRACENYDRNLDEAMFGFRRGYQCAE